MYVVFSADFEMYADDAVDSAATLEQAFARIACRCGYSYHFELIPEGWRMVLVDVERPSCSPDPILSPLKKAADAKRDLMGQAVDGRLKRLIALPLADFERQRLSAVKRLADGDFDVTRVRAG